MASTYLVEIRLSRTKWRIKKITTQIAQEHGIGDYIEPHPHVTLFGPLMLNEGITGGQLLDAIGEVAARYDPVPFLLDGWEKRDGMHGSVIAFPVRASEPLRQLSREIAGALQPITTSQNLYDHDPDRKWFHVTIANRLEAARAEAVFLRLTARPGNPEPDTVREERPGLLQLFFHKPKGERLPRPIPPVLLDETGIRITVMQDMSILAEYDLIDKRWLFGDHRHNTPKWQKTLGQYRHHAGFEHRDPAHGAPDDVFVIADLHLGHANIIRYCSRPFLFADTGEMDHVLIKNWNYSVGPRSRIYCLGDLRYGPGAATASDYRKRLRGDIIFIRGNHDDDEPGTFPLLETEYEGQKYLLVHDPADAPAAYDGWIIHGHHHNNDLRQFPFMNFAARRINVSAEVTGYKPVSLREIGEQIKNREQSGDTTPILIRYNRNPELLPF